MAKSKYFIELVIDTEEDDPNYVSDFLGLQSTKIIVKGEHVFHPKNNSEIIRGKFNENNIWVFSIRTEFENKNLYLNDAISDFLKKFDSNPESLKALLKKYPNNHLKCVSYYYETNPFFRLDLDIIEKLHNYSLKLTFDFYMLAEDL